MADTTPDPEVEQLIPGWLADNYRQIFSDPDRGITPQSLAEQADTEGDANLAAWARGQAAAAGEDVTPATAKPRATAKRGGKPKTAEVVTLETSDDVDEEQADAADESNDDEEQSDS